MKKRFTGILAAMSLASLLTIGAGAQGIVRDVIDGAENVVDDVGDAAEDIVDGGNNNNGNNDNNGQLGGSGTDNGIVDDTQDPDIPDQIEDDTNDQPNQPGNNTGKDENTVIPPPTEDDPNPSTGVPFMTAGLVALSAAGVAYLTKRRNEYND